MTEVNLFEKSVLQKLYRYGCALCGNEDRAYDLLQHALEKYLQNTASVRPSNEISYVRSIMRNQFIDEYRKSRRFPEESYDDSATFAIDEASLENVVIAQADLEIVWKKLDLFEREIMYYWAVEEMTAKEIAEQIDVPRGTVLSKIYRLRKRIESETDSGRLAGGARL